MPVERACALLGLSRALYYRTPRNPAEAKEKAASLLERIESILLEFPGYGYRRVTAHLQRDGVCVNRKRGLSVKRKESLLCRNRRRWTTTIDSEHGLSERDQGARRDGSGASLASRHHLCAAAGWLPLRGGGPGRLLAMGYWTSTRSWRFVL
jgi:hypothetical protein